MAGESRSTFFSMSSATNWTKTSGVTCSFVIFAALNISMVWVGSDALDKCRIEKMVPMYLIVAGSTSLSLLLVRLFVSHFLMPKLEKYLSRSADPEATDLGQVPGNHVSDKPAMYLQAIKALRIFDSFASIFSTCWLIAGSCYVYGISPTYDDPEAPTFCLHRAYWFAYIVITIGYISLALSIAGALCALFCKGEK